MTASDDGLSSVPDERPDGFKPLPRALPSENYELGSINVNGFVQNPSKDFIAKAGLHVAKLASAVSCEPSEDLRQIRVRISHIQSHPMLPPRLFGFHLYEFDSEGEPVDPLSEGATLRYALVVNNSLELQTEVVLVFLMTLLDRQALLSGSPDLRDIDIQAAESDKESLERVRDRLRSGIVAATEFVRARAVRLSRSS